MSEEIDVVQDNDIDKSFDWDSTGDPEVKTQSSACRKLKARKSGSGFRLKGRVTEPGSYTVTITETKTKTVKINVARKMSFGDSSPLEVITGNRRPADPES